MPEARTLTGFREIADDFDLVLMDLWGCVHDGVKPYPAALDCLARLKDAGKIVAILSNAPRRASEVGVRLTEMGVDAALYDQIFTSGEETWHYLNTRPDGLGQRLGRRVYAITAERDHGMFDGLNLQRVDDIAEATFVLVTGIADPKIQGKDFDPLLKQALKNNLPLICANPDLVVHRGGIEEICAGAIAQRYEAFGGRVVYHGKPHAKTYEAIFKSFKLGSRSRAIGVGDSFRTDVKGAQGVGAKALLIGSGIHRAELVRGGRIDKTLLNSLANRFEIIPDFGLAQLAW